MTTLFELLSGKEEELLSFFKDKYNLVEKAAPVSQPTPQVFDRSKDPHNIPNAFPQKPTTETNKVTKGIGNLFGGTSWGNK